MHFTAPQRGERVRIRLIAHRWQEECLSRGLRTDTSRAVAFGIDRATIIRVQNGDADPGARFVARVLVTLRGRRFEDLFEVTTGDKS